MKSVSLDKEKSLILKSKHMPIPIHNGNELAFLFLQEFYKKKAKCDVSSLDAHAVLRVIIKAPCFPESIKSIVRDIQDNVINRWVHAILEDWTEELMDDACLNSSQGCFLQIRNCCKN